MANFARSARPSRPLSLSVLAVAYLALAWAGNAAVAAWNAFEYPYNDRIDVTDVVRDMLSLPIGDVAKAFYELGLVNIVVLISFGLAAAAIWTDTMRRHLLKAASLIVLPFGLLGLMSLIGVARDGEWLAEGWVLLEALAIWSVILWAYTLAKHKAPSTIHQPAPAV